MNAASDEKNVTVVTEVHSGSLDGQASVWMIPISRQQYESRGRTQFAECQGALKAIGPLPADHARQFEDVLLRALDALGYQVHKSTVTGA